MTGAVGDVRAAVAAGVATIKQEGMLVADVVISLAHPGLLPSLL
jgi:microcompartment protein CcmL/EutN